MTMKGKILILIAKWKNFIKERILKEEANGFKELTLQFS